MGVTLGVVPLDVVEARRILEGRLGPIQPAHPPVQSRISSANVFQVDFEMLSIDRIEANECRE